MFIIRFFPNHPTALVQMVQLCSEWRASKCYLDTLFDNAIARKPDAPATYVAQGIWLHRSKKYASAIAVYHKALTLDPSSINAHYNLGLTYFETRQYDLANEEAQQAYALGAPLPGLREQLTKVGRWKPLPNASGASTEWNETPTNREAGAQPSSSSAVPP
jgi:tetratricopeptide (TPR) repeat protein